MSDSNKPTPQDRARLPEQDISGINVHDKESVMNLFEDKLEMRVVNVGMALSMSSVTGLADLAEDEIIPKPIPMQVSILTRLSSYVSWISPFIRGIIPRFFAKRTYYFRYT